MKALKYGLTLVLGLSMLSGTGLRAQNIELAPPSEASPAGPTWQPKHEPPHLSETLRKYIASEDYNRALSEFEKYKKSASLTECEMVFVHYTFYSLLLDANTDTAKIAFYQGKIDTYANSFLQSCGNTVEGCIMKMARQVERIPDSTVAWMTIAIKLEPEMPMLYNTRGSALWELGQTEEACADFKKAKELDANMYADYYDTHCVKPEETAETVEGTPAEAPAPVTE